MMAEKQCLLFFLAFFQILIDNEIGEHMKKKEVIAKLNELNLDKKSFNADVFKYFSKETLIL